MHRRNNCLDRARLPGMKMLPMDDDSHKISYPLHEQLLLAGKVILVAGLLLALTVYVFAAQHGGDNGAAQASAHYTQQLELIGGPFQLVLVELDRWFASLWQGTNLAYTLAVLALLSALACFWLSSLLAGSDELPPED